MSMDDAMREAVLDALDDDGAVYKLDDGSAYRVKVEQDPDTQVTNFETYGAFSEAKDFIRHGEDHRPAGFTGNAEKLQFDRGYWCWWEPNSDGPKRGTEEFSAERRQVLDLLECGFSGVIVERLDGLDAYGRDIVVAVASLWGIDSLENGYLREVVGELLSEIDA